MTACTKCSASEFLFLQGSVQAVFLAMKANSWLACYLTSPEPRDRSKEKARSAVSSWKSHLWWTAEPHGMRSDCTAILLPLFSAES